MPTIGFTGSSRSVAPASSLLAGSLVDDPGDLELDVADGSLHHDHVADTLLQERAADRRAPADAALFRVALVLPDELVALLRSLLVFDLDRGAEEDDVGVLLRRIDDDGGVEPLLEEAN